ncbi:UNKNOWN [Stylonychia lemnae]|uniref:Tpr domain containing protein n=1 Tax=Stylonychia lemnae TaxID=5949 RepID=A0A078AU32_STYLE|nr:UNKNOWN [Stylonychia lemnae]|eukprot:CDW85759.1 UNKNOWN [Stylonychia lemnae]
MIYQCRQAIDGEIKKGGPLDKKSGQNQQAIGSFTENESFNRHYNKELKVSEDEIPIVLLELNESALAFITREQFEKALLLLQKAHGVLDVVDLSNCKRDQMIALEIFLNMALCYQKLGQLEECSLCLETCIEHLSAGDYLQQLKNQSLAMRIMKMKLECKLRMQLCAILSQLHRHREALEQAYESAKIGNVIVQDQIHLCEYISKRVDFESMRNMNKHQTVNAINLTEDSQNGLDNESSFSQEDGLNIVNQSVDSITQYQSPQAFQNNLEDSISLIERSAKKLLPIYKELHKRLVQIRKSATVEQKSNKNDFETDRMESDDLTDIDLLNDNSNNKRGLRNKSLGRITELKKRDPSNEKKLGDNLLDMRHMLGFLNQSEWVTSLNIGNIMQISPIQHEDLIAHRRNEQEISRDAFLESVGILQQQLFEEISQINNFDSAFKTKESEYWHAKSLEVACTFLPSDCPLLNHVLLSYQKHHAPSSTAIPENQTTEEILEIMKPLLGIENNKFQPIIRRIQNIKIELSPVAIKSAKSTVKKLLRKIQPQTIPSLNNLTPLDTTNAQISTAVKTPQNINQLHKEKIVKIMKFEKVMKKFCKNVGVDKLTLLTMLVGKSNIEEFMNKNELSSRKDSLNQSRENLITKDSIQMNTGQAAQLAYNNMISGIDPDQPQGQNYVRVRNQVFKSRNGNYSFSENRENVTAPIYAQQNNLLENLTRGSVSDVLNKNYESENSIFHELKNNLNENSFNEQILEKNRINMNSREAANSSIVGTILSKRQNSNEKLTPLRPRSSKGNRQISNNGQMQFLGSHQQIIQNSKFGMNKSEERTKSQQQSRTLNSGSKQKSSNNETFSKMLQQNLLMNQQQQQQLLQAHQSLKMQKKSFNNNNGQNNENNSSSNPLIVQETKKNKINYDDLKKYLIKEYQSQKQQNKLSNLYLKQDDITMLQSKSKTKQGNNGGRSGKNLGQQQQQIQLSAQNIVNQQKQQQQQIYMTQQRPISVGAVGNIKKRDKNKALMQELLNGGGNKNKLLAGAPLVGFLGNHNLSVNITNIAGNVNGLRQQQFFDDDMKQINNNNANSGFIRAVGGAGSLVGIENLLPNHKLGQFMSFDGRRKSQPQ